MKRLLFVAVVYNTIAETRDLCLSLSQQAPGDFEILLVLVDNSDLPEAQSAVDSLAQEFRFTLILRPGNNLGYFPAISAALERYALDFDLVIAGNNDLKYSEEFSKALSIARYPDDVMVICPDVVTANCVHQNPHRKRRTPPLDRLFFDLYFSSYHVGRVIRPVAQKTKHLLAALRRSKLESNVAEPAQIIEQGIGAVYIFTSEFLKKIGYSLYFPAFLYGEEACLAWQVRSVGGRTWYDPSLQVWHAESATLSHLPSRRTYRFARESYWKFRSKL